MVRVPRPGEIVHAREGWEVPAGGGAVAAVQLARLAGGGDFFTALGRDELGRRALRGLEQLGLRVHVAWREAPTRRALTYIDDQGERTIVTLGERLAPAGADELPWELLAKIDAVYFTAGDADALRAARRAQVVVANPRAADAMHAGVAIDALVLSADDAQERHYAEDLGVAVDLLVFTEGAHGGSYRRAEGAHGRWSAAPAPSARADSYGCGDSFAAGVTYGLGAGMGVDAALALAARCGAMCLTGSGPYERQLAAGQI